MTAQAKLAQAEYDLAQTQRNVSLAGKKLSEAMGELTGSPHSATGELSLGVEPSEEQDLDVLLKEAPEVRRLAMTSEAARRRRQAAKAEYYPSVNVSLGASATGEEIVPDGDTELRGGLSVSFPLFQGGKTRQKVKRAQAQYRQAKADETSGRSAALIELEEAWKELQDAAGAVKIREMFYEAAAERAEIAQAQYSNGLLSFDNWTIIENELVNSEKALLAARAVALIAEAAWIHAKGGTLDEE